MKPLTLLSARLWPWLGRHPVAATTRHLSPFPIAKLLPGVLEGESGIAALAALIRSYFRLNGHHIQFNVVDTSTLRKAQASPADYRDLLVRVAGYSDYFVDLDRSHQEEIISRTEQESF